TAVLVTLMVGETGVISTVSVASSLPVLPSSSVTTAVTVSLTVSPALPVAGAVKVQLTSPSTGSTGCDAASTAHSEPTGKAGTSTSEVRVTGSAEVFRTVTR